MTGVLALYDSTIGKKIVMALSGACYVGWVLFHMVGNLQFHLGPTAMNEYAYKLQSMPALVWSGRTFLFVALAVHVVTAISLIRSNAEARSTAYQGPKGTYKTTGAAKAMRYGGLFLLLFIIVHLLDFTVRAYADFPIPLAGALGYGAANLGFVHGEVFHNMVLSFTNPLSLTFYVVGMVFLGLHLYHGAWSMFQTLGFEAATRQESFYRNVAGAIATIVVVGNLSIVGSGLLAGLTDRATITGHGSTYYGEQIDVPAGLKVDGVELTKH